MVHELAYRLMSTSRLWMGLLGSAYLLVTAFALATLFAWIRGLAVTSRNN
jgi:hypothetical protein